jgi:FXSXX-COOH protein
LTGVCLFGIDFPHQYAALTLRGETTVNAGPDQVADSDGGRTLLVDVRHTPVADLVAADGTALSRSLRRVLDSLDDPDGVLSAFSSFASS